MTTYTDNPSKVTDVDDIAQTLGIATSSDRRWGIIKWATVAAIIIVIAGIALLWPGSRDYQAIRYETTEVRRGDLVVTVTATGTLEPVNQVAVGSEFSGTINTVAVDVNSRVRQGQVLAVMNTDQLQSRVKQAQAGLQLSKAQVQQAEATVRETRNSLRRAKELAQSGMCSEEDCDAAKAAYDRAEANLLIAKAQVFQAQASLEAEQTTLAKATIHSPIDGIVLKRSVEPGQTVAASLQTPVLFTLAEDLTKMELHVNVDEADVGQVVVGQEAFFNVDAYPDKHFPAKITEVHFASQTVESVVTYETVLRVDNSEFLLRPGMTATSDITVNKVQNALLIANAALRFSPPAHKEQASTGDGGLVSRLIPRPPRAGSKSRDQVIVDNKQGRVWVQRDGQPVAISITTGSTDGIATEVIAGDIEAGMVLIIDTVSTGQ